MKWLSDRIRKVFDIRSGELSISLLMQLYIFLIISALLVVKPTVNALFLSELGADALAEAFVIIALAAVAGSLLYNKSLERFKLKSLIRYTLMVFTVIFMIMGVLIAVGYFNGFLAYCFYTIVALFALLATSQFWVMANVVFNVREAKRLFGFIGAGGIAGGIVGGYLTSLLAEHVGNGALLILASFMIMGCIFVMNSIWRNRVDKLSSFKRKERATVSSESSVKLIFNSKHLSALAAVIGIGVLVAKLVDYQFSYISSRNIPDSQELASFFGFWFSTFNIVSLVIQLFITRHILSKSGVSTGLAALPIGIVFCCVVLLFIPELWVVIVLKGLDGSLKQSLHKSAVELLALPIPSDVKNKTKTFIDVVVDSVATGLAGLILIFIVRAFDLSPVFITILILVLVVAWVIMIMKVRDAYFGTFKEMIVSKEQIKLEKRSNSLIRNNMKVVFESGGSKDILYMLDRVPELAHRSLKAPIINLLEHSDPHVVASAIANLKYVDRGHPVGKVHDLIYTENDEVVLAAMQYLMSQDTKFPEQFFENYLDHESDYISSAALLCLAQETEDNPKLAAKYNLDLRINLFLDELDRNEGNFRKEEVIELVKAIGYAKGENRHRFILRYFENPDHELRTAAILAAGNTAHENFLPLLINELDDARFRESAIIAISNYGNSIITYLIKRYKDPVAPIAVKKYLPDILLELGTTKAVRALLSLSQEGSLKLRTRITNELSVFKKAQGDLHIPQRVYFKIIRSECEQYRLLEACYYCQRIVERSNLHPERVIDIHETGSRKELIIGLRKALDNNLKRIFNILALHFNSRDVFIAYRGLQSDKKETRRATMEFLEGLISRNFKTQLFPIIESSISSHDANLSEINDRIHLPTEKQCYLQLLELQDRALNKLVIQVIVDSGNEDFMPLLVRATTKKDPIVAAAASEAYLKMRNIRNIA
ncbi:Npt1/Npt2 family nucleotide transporter [Nonlabens sp. YIK11]|uniref:Npt1/Npt2 family nucleotide transporter n=1 Tax=Nonlabens sp. YIK11 TaxID=1453349 RepID=UPI0009E8B7D6|nr:Npt1/Npt2 family nucleotide transporter [Nonlabens sp. YIK11]